jgi:autotransporter translocation and assembly factor TamB
MMLRWVAALLLAAAVTQTLAANAQSSVVLTTILVPVSQPDMQVSTGQPPVDLHGIPQLDHSTLAAT